MAVGVLEKDNHERCIRVCYDAAKIVHYKQRRLNKAQLKMSQIASALVLVHFYHWTMFKFVSCGQLACNFKGCTENLATEYYSNSVVGDVNDVHGRKVKIEPSGVRSLYKDQAGKHHVASENYIPMRGKRLPWIRHILTNARSIFRIDEKIRGEFHRTYLYGGLATIPLAAGSIENYFLVLVREENKVLRYLTSFEVDSHNAFLKRIEEGVPYVVG